VPAPAGQLLRAPAPPARTPAVQGIAHDLSEAERFGDRRRLPGQIDRCVDVAFEHPLASEVGERPGQLRAWPERLEHGQRRLGCLHRLATTT